MSKKHLNDLQTLLRAPGLSHEQRQSLREEAENLQRVLDKEKEKD